MRHRQDPVALTVIAIFILLVLGIPLSLAFWYYRDDLVYLGLFFLALIILSSLSGVLFLFLLVINKFKTPPIAVPSTREGVYLVRGRKVERLVPMTAEQQPVVDSRSALVNHVPVHLDYAVPDDPPTPEEYDEETCHMDTSELAPSYDEMLALESIEAYNNGATSGDKMYKVLNDLGYEVSVRQARQIVKTLKEKA